MDGEALSMARKQPLVVMYDVDTEIRKVLRGRPTKATVEFLVHAMAPAYFAALEQKDVTELESLFNLEDPRA